MTCVAASTQLTNPDFLKRSLVRRNPLVLWHLLSLDAPSVATLWTWFIARATRTPLPGSLLFAMFLAVWLLYAADRLLDTRDTAPQSQHQLEERHFFHRSHFRDFRVGMLLASLALAALLPRLPAPTLRLDAMLSALLFAYFVLIHTAAATRSLGLTKELAVGVFFSASSFIPTVSSQPGLHLTLLPAAILFAALCSLNCLFIHTWEHPANAATNSGLRMVSILAAVVFLGGITLALFDQQIPLQIPFACALASALLLLLHGNRNRLARGTLRAATDLCLLTPVILLPLLPR